MGLDQIAHETSTLPLGHSMYGHLDPAEQPGQPAVTPQILCDSNTDALAGTASAYMPEGEASGMSAIEYAQRELENALQSALSRPWRPLRVKFASERTEVACSIRLAPLAQDRAHPCRR